MTLVVLGGPAIQEHASEIKEVGTVDKSKSVNWVQGTWRT